MFRVLKIRVYYLRIVRLISILFIAFKFLVINWLSGRRRLRRFVPKKYKNREVIKTLPERLKIMLENLGPTFVKFGQFLAGRPDIVSEKLREELKKLQSNAQPFEDSRALKLIEQELGGPISSFFLDFETNCYASASIGQVYRARMKDGTEVILKIQRPDIESKVKLDVYLIRILASRLAKEYPGLKAVDMVGFVEEFGETLTQEMDYLIEASNARRFDEMFKNAGYCKIPYVYEDLCTKKLLVMEYVTGALADNVSELISEGHDPKKVARNGMHIFLKMIIQHGFFHADPHAGNMYVQENNRIAMIDFGMVGSLKPLHIGFLANFAEGVATHNAAIITDALLELCQKKFYHDKDNLEFHINEMLLRHVHQDYESIRFSHLLNECLKIMLRFELKLPASIYLLLKSVATIEKVGYKLDPELSLASMIKPYSEEILKKKYSPKRVAEEIYQTFYDYGSLIREFPAEVNEILYKLKEGKLINDMKIRAGKNLISGMQSAGKRFAGVFLIGVMLVCAVVLNIWGDNNVVGNILLVIAVFFAVAFFLKPASS